MDTEGEHWCNIWLEYAAGGSLADRIQSFGRGLPESKVRPYTKSVLLDTNDDLSMSVSGNRRVKESIAKIADLGLAKKARQRQKGKGTLRGTALYMAPESIQDEQYDSHTDIWALGCMVLQMMTSKEPWEYGPDTEREDILLRIGFTEDMPEIPRDLSKEAQDFLKKCLVRDPKSRWTADMLLGHPFVSVADSAFTRSIEDKRNRIVLPKTVKAVLN
ncbi:Mitogen-activated protein kinase kinase kinase 18 [Camellia lanceoleosa]|uniref:Mitogen-activated protein kinase kinase kinase 18 n=1 Tax=Camellia lanceoleosa TaxID=1840588 RepID=A0ACC0G3F0_9ERIC|nr:Mitogen-activated protein kinase kinase kinase 18 [Camellia lanceoleosa]